jgi:hypothetical protein
LRLSSVRRAFKASDTRLQIGDGLFQRTLVLLERTHSTVDLRVRELDHGLSLGRCSLDPVFQTSCGSVDLFIRQNDGFRNESQLIAHPFGDDIEMTTGNLSYIIDMPTSTVGQLLDTTTGIRMCGRVLLPHRLEQTFQFVIGHEVILLRALHCSSGYRLHSRVKSR